MAENSQTIQTRMGDGNVVGTTLRLPRFVRDEMKIQAIRAGRSFNTHVVMILQQALAEHDVRA
ncbi:Arc family DNA-binding protein [Paracoccus sp. (in: a-proteobacteria)]|uniref:Arc family DNA-binding protein n=1 Tax=Paracoccus sp. TaxID=267 RepID=UPI0028AD8AA7|nr:Arc family DNA-binding protein [Paracoccus sp. (in: a-proteobacteria)]